MESATAPGHVNAIVRDIQAAVQASKRVIDAATQYVRHHTVPFYTPEPDVIHEVIGHCNALAHPALAELYRVAGAASRHCKTDECAGCFSQVISGRRAPRVRSIAGAVLLRRARTQATGTISFMPLE